jgi:type III restriction enzyme
VEKAKIECARKHFATVSSDVVFDWVNSYERFKDIVNRSIQKNNVVKGS